MPLRPLIVCLLLLAGCGLEPTGYSAPYPPPQPFAVVVPQNAASISQQYRPGQGSADHLGIDFISPMGTPVLAAASGRVTRSYFDPTYGNTVEISHGTDAEGRPILTRYAHLQTRIAQAGQSVARGEQIATLGRSGVLGGFPHLHFEVWFGSLRDQDNTVDPNTLWVGGTGRVTCFAPGQAIPNRPFRITHPVTCR